MGKRIEKGRHSYRGDLVRDEFASTKKEKPSPKTDHDTVQDELVGDSTIDQISGDPYLADLIRKHGEE